MRHAPSVFLSVILLGVVMGAEPVTAPAVVPAAAPAVAVTYGPSHWLSTAGWKGGPAEHYNPTMISIPPAADGAAAARVVEIGYTGGAKDKAAILHPVTKEDLATHPALSFSVLNPGEQPVQIAVAIKTGKTWVYHESAAQNIPPKGKEPTVLTFDLEASVYKTAASKWAANSAIADLTELREVQIVIMNGGFTGQVTIADAQIREQNPAK